MPSAVPAAVLAAVLAIVPAGHVAVGAAVGDDFEGPAPSWVSDSADVEHRIDLHARVHTDAHSGRSCEQIRLSAATGTFVYVRHEVGRARVIAELVPTVWIKADRPGVQILARVVLPRTLDPQTGQPLVALVRGSSYTHVGSWQRLAIEELPRLLEREVRVLRLAHGPHVDSREAYVDRVLLNIYGGRGVTNVRIDDLAINGYLQTPPRGDRGSPSPVSAASQASHRATLPNNKGDWHQPGRVRWQGSVLLVDGHPFFPRMIEHCGEDFAWLRRLGFNAVKLRSPPTPDQLKAAEQAGLMLVSPPPDVRPGRTIGPSYRPVLAWDLGSGLSTGELPSVRRFAAEVRAADSLGNRPLVCAADSDLRAYSRLADMLVLNASPLGTDLELADFGPWLQRRGRLARPGAPIWAAIQTEPNRRLLAQLAAFSEGVEPAVAVEPEQIRLLAYSAVAAGARALCFRSHTRLDGDDPRTQLRAAALERLNIELSRVAPWAAAGRPITAIDTDDPQLRVAVLQTDRTRLLLLMRVAPGAQCVTAAPAQNAISLVVPGVPESSSAYQLTSSGPAPLRHRRVTGGMRVTLDNFALASMVVLTQDPLAISALSRQAAATGDRAARLRHELAARTLTLVENVDRRLAALPGASAPGTASSVAGASIAGASSRAVLAAAKADLRQSELLLQKQDPAAASRLVGQSMRRLAQLRRTHWEKALRGFNSPVSSPYCTSFATLPLHWSLAERLRRSRLGPNLLPGGDCENLQYMRDSGWRHYRHDEPDINTVVEVVREGTSGGRVLRLFADSADPSKGPAQVETPPVWITSAPVPLRPWQIVRIHGRVRIPRPIIGSTDGLLVIDSLGGRPLAHRLGRTDGWADFVSYRAAPAEGHRLTVTVALSGLGEAFLDDLVVTAFEPTGGEAPRIPSGPR